MRSAFGILESFVALIVFSVVILVCSQTLLAMQKELKIFKEHQRKQNALFNAMLYLENQLRYGFISKISSQGVEYFEIHRHFFFSFDPYLKQCNSNRIEKIADTQFIAFFSPSLQIARVIGQDQQGMVLDRKAECGVMIPLRAKRRIFLDQNKKLYIDANLLLEGVNEFVFKQESQEFEIKLCLDSCLTHRFPKLEIFYAF